MTSILIVAAVVFPSVFAAADCNTGLSSKLTFELSAATPGDILAEHEAAGTIVTLQIFGSTVNLYAGNDMSPFLDGQLQ